MEIMQAIKERRTIHSFSKTRVPKEIIERSIDAANQAPCHRMTFPWRFTSIGRNKRELILELQLKIKFGDKPIDQKNIDRTRAKVLNPSHLLIASQVSKNNQVQAREDYAACACAIQNLSLSLVANGVGSKWSTGEITTDMRTYEIAEIIPSEEEIIGFIWIGYGDIPTPINRPSIISIFREKY
tara:strand:+ start:121 stop:672 length:552 start_codon:yes stop_codon:yes gene_type:complete